MWSMRKAIATPAPRRLDLAHLFLLGPHFDQPLLKVTAAPPRLLKLMAVSFLGRFEARLKVSDERSSWYDMITVGHRGRKGSRV